MFHTATVRPKRSGPIILYNTPAWMNGFNTVPQYQWFSGKTKTSYALRKPALEININTKSEPLALDSPSLHDCSKRFDTLNTVNTHAVPHVKIYVHVLAQFFVFITNIVKQLFIWAWPQSITKLRNSEIIKRRSGRSGWGGRQGQSGRQGRLGRSDRSGQQGRGLT